MPNLSFNDNQNSSIRRAPVKKTMSDRLIDWGLAKNKKQADLILLIVAMICIAITVYNLTSLGSSTAPTTAPNPELSL